MAIPNRGLVALVLVVLLAGCSPGNGSSGSGADTSGPIPRLSGQLVVTGESTLDLISAGRRSVIAHAPSVNAYFEYPAFSPDGKQVAYVLSLTPTAQGQDWGNDIYTSNLDGSDAKLVLKHDHIGTLVDSLSWTPDGTALVYAYQRSLYDAQNHYTGSIFRVDRLTLTTGVTNTLLNNAQFPSVSPDGKQIVYVDVPQTDFDAQSLALANIDGSQQRSLLPDQKGFQGYFAPHLSPDGTKVTFAAIGGPLDLTPTPGARAPFRPAALGDLAALFRAPTAQADGSPYQVWVANIDGSGLHTLSSLREDLPFPVWQADGKVILFLGAAGLYIANSDGSNFKRIGAGVPHGEIAWFQPG